MVAFKKIQQNRMYESIVNQVLEALLRGDLRPHDKLPSEKELATIFGVSRVTVREAIRSMEQFGVIEVRQGSRGGAYIKEMDLDSVVEQIGNALRMTSINFQNLAEARATLEEIIVRRLIPSKIKKKDFDRLQENVAEAEQKFKENKERERLLENFRFHTILAEITDNPIIILMHKLIVDLSLSFFENVKPSNAMIQKTIGYHREVVALLKEKQFEKASEMCSHHIQEVSKRIVEKSKKQSLLKKP